jgi:hypothetical protein
MRWVLDRCREGAMKINGIVHEQVKAFARCLAGAAFRLGNILFLPRFGELKPDTSFVGTNVSRSRE